MNALTRLLSGLPASPADAPATVPAALRRLLAGQACSCGARVRRGTLEAHAVKAHGWDPRR